MMKNYKHVFWLWLVVMLAIPKAVWAIDYFEPTYSYTFQVSIKEAGCLHFKLMYMDQHEGLVTNGYLEKTNAYPEGAILRAKDEDGTTYDILTLYTDNNGPVISKSEWDVWIQNKNANSILLLTNNANDKDVTYGGVNYGAKYVTTGVNKYTLKKPSGSAAQDYAELDWYYPTDLAGKKLKFYLSGHADHSVGDFTDRELLGSPITMDKKPELTVSDPVFYPMGDTMGYYHLLVSNTSGEKLQLTKVAEMDGTGEKMDITQDCKSSDDGMTILVPAVGYARTVKVNVRVPFSKYIYLDMEDKYAKLNAFHNAKDFKLQTAWGKKGSSVLTWTVPNAADEDALSTDAIAVERQLYDANDDTKTDEWEVLDYVPMEQGKSTYEYTDSTKGCFGDSIHNSVRYRIYRVAVGVGKDWYSSSEMVNKREQISWGSISNFTATLESDNRIKLRWKTPNTQGDEIHQFIPEGSKLLLVRAANFYRKGEQEVAIKQIDVTTDHESEEGGYSYYYDNDFTLCTSYEYSLLFVPNDPTGVMKTQEEVFATKLEPLKSADAVLKTFTASSNTLQDRIHLQWAFDVSQLDSIRLYKWRDDTWKLIDNLNPSLRYYDDYDVEAGKDVSYRLGVYYECTDGSTSARLETKGMRRASGKIGGFVTFEDGTGLQNVNVQVLQGETVKFTQKTDATGAYLFDDVPYSDTPYVVRISSNTYTEFDRTQIPVYLNATQPFFYDKNFISSGSFTLDGYVYFEQTTVPIYGATFQVDGVTVIDKGGNPVISDNDGHFSFSVKKGAKKVTVQKEGHTFMYNGVYSDNKGKAITINEPATGIFFWDQTKVRTIGRVVGGLDQGEKPLGFGQSVNNLGDDLRIVLELEGNQRSWLVKDQLNDALTVKYDTLVHEQTTEKLKNAVTTERHRVVITPNVTTGEYMADLLPTRYKVVEVSASGYPSLFQKGKVSEVLDLTDSLTTQTITIDGKSVNYQAIYNRIFRQEPTVTIVEVDATTGEAFDHVGLASYAEPAAVGETSISVPLYDAATQTYTFGYPVLEVGTHNFRITATENYYYNGIQTGRKDIVPLRGGKIHIYDDFSAEQDDYEKTLDTTTGSVDISIDVQNTVYDVAGNNALRHLDVTLEHEGQFIDGENLDAFVMGYQKITDDVMSTDGVINLLGILRDPPGSKSYAWIDTETHYQSSFDFAIGASLSLKIGLKSSTGTSIMSGAYAGTNFAGTYMGTQTSAETNWEITPKSIPLIGFEITRKGGVDFLLTERLQTSDDPSAVGADADIYYGYELVQAISAIRNVRAINQATYDYLNEFGLFNDADGACHLISQGTYSNGQSYYLISDYNYMAGPQVKSTFSYTQKYILGTLIPKLKAMRNSYLYKGTREQAQAQANATMRNVFFSLRDEDDPRYGQDNLDEECDYISIDRYDEYRDQLNYEVIPPAYVDMLGLRAQLAEDASAADSVRILNRKIAQWEYIVANNEFEKVTAFAAIDAIKRDSIKYNPGTPYDVKGNSNFYVENHTISGDMMKNHTETFSSSDKFDYKVPLLGKDLTNWSAKNNTDFIKKVVKGGMSVATERLNGSIQNAKFMERFQKKWGSDATVLVNYKDDAGGAVQQMELTKDQLKQVSTVKDMLDGLRGAQEIEIKTGGSSIKMSMEPEISTTYDSNSEDATKTNVVRGYQLETDGDSHLSVDVYHDVMTVSSGINMVGATSSSRVLSQGNYLYRTMGGATKCPYEGEETTEIYAPGTVLSAATAKVEKPRITVEKHIISGVPYGETAKFNLVLSNEGTIRTEGSFDLVLLDRTNQMGASLIMDGAPLGNGRSLVVPYGTGMVKVLEIGQGLVDDYENIRLALRSQCDMNVADTVNLSVHFVPSASPIAVITPQNKWVLNTNSAQDSRGRYYMPVSIGGFDVNFHNFDHVELQYKQSSEPESRWTNLCSYYDNDSLYQAGAGTKAMLSGGTITHAFYGDSDPVELNYDLRAVTYSRLGNDFVTKASPVFSGIKDTRRPQLFGAPQPANNILGVGDELKLVFSEDINANRLLATNNFKVTGLPNNSEIVTSTSLAFESKDSRLQSVASTNWNGDSYSIDVMLKTTENGTFFEYGPYDCHLELYLSKENRIEARVVNQATRKFKGLFSKTLDVDWNEFHRVVVTYSKSEAAMHIYVDGENVDGDFRGAVNGVTGSSYWKVGTSFQGNMKELRIWMKELTPEDIANTSGTLYGNEVDLLAYYPMDEGKGDVVEDKAQGANMTMVGDVSWGLPKGASLKLNAVRGKSLNREMFENTSEEKSYTLSLWFKAKEKENFPIMASGRGVKDEENAQEKLFIGVRNGKLMIACDSVDIEMNKSYADNQWHHLALVVDRLNNLASAYVDGDLMGQKSARGFGKLYGSQAFELGSVAGGTEQMDGYIDEITLWNMALPQNIIKQKMNVGCDGSEIGLLFYIPFSENVQQITGGGTRMEFSSQYFSNRWDTETKKSVVVKGNAFNSDVQLTDAMKTTNEYAPIKEKGKERNLLFDFITKGDELILALKELPKDIERTTVNITAMGIEDLNGNEMAQPVQWSAYIHQNTVRWTTQKKQISINAEDEGNYTFDIDISNSGGKYHSYTIEGLPDWITVEEGTMGDLDPEEVLTLHITISKDINIGEYDEVLYLKNDEELVDPLALKIVKRGKTPEWTFKKNTLRNMQICAQVTMAGQVVTDKNNVIGSFDEYGNCMGTANIMTNQQGKSMLFMTIYPQKETKAPITFRMWQASTGITYQLVAESAIYYDPDTIYGSYEEPVELKTTENILQEMVLEPVWTWVSLNVKSPNAGNITNLLSKVEWDNGDQLKDPENQAFYNYNKGAWHYSKGDVKDSLTCDRMYYIMVKTAKKVQIDGTSLEDESLRTITIRNGWNYIGYTPMMNLPVKEALIGFSSKATEGDIIKSQDEFATFSKDAGWQGNLRYMKPGKGYMLYHKAASENETVSFVYPYKSLNEAASAKVRADMDEEPLMVNTHLTTMNMVTRTSGIEAQEGDCLYAYANGELRGVAKAVMLDDQPTFFLSVGGEKPEGLSFTLERDGELLGSTVNAATYRADTLEGTTDLPKVIDFSDVIAYENGVWYTLTGLRVGERRPTTPGVYIFNGQKVLVK